jgi:hypothetical protein
MAKNEQKKTIAFVCFGIGAVLIAVFTHFATRPDSSKDFELVGQPFYENFTSAAQAKSLEVAALDPETSQLKQFSVAEKDGVWRIPSHYDYPAEAAERLATTATSVMGIDRESLVGRLSSDHERFGVVDPLGDEASDPEATGKRITLKDGDNEILADYIIGKEAGEVEIPVAERAMQEGSPDKYYYVRRPDEAQTYKVRLNVDLSTRFSDWIEPDLLKLQANQIRRINIDNYELQEQGGLASRQIYKVEGDKLSLSRQEGFGKWNLDGLNDATEQLNDKRVTDIVNVLDQMKIVGVRPKFKYKDQLLLTPDLKVNQIPELEQNPREFTLAMAKLQNELSQRGFNFIKNPDLTLVSNGGELSVGTDEGVVYSLNIGKSVEGDESAIEIGSSDESGDSKPDNSEATESTNADAKNQTATADAASDSANSGNAPDDESTSEESAATETKNRYLMIRVAFDESLLGEKPVAPTEPTKPVEPEGYTPPPETDKPAATDKPATATEQEKSAGEADAAPTPEQPQERDPAFVAYDLALQEYKQQMTEYTLNKTRYENELKEFDKRVAAGHKLVDELNERFGSWYYVISADNLKSLITTRADLVSAKEQPAAARVDADELPSVPDINFEMPEDDSATQPPTTDSPDPGADKGSAQPPQPTEAESAQAGDETDDNPPTQVPDDTTKSGGG